MSNYERGAVFPGPLHLKILAEALECEVADLIPRTIVPSAEDRVPAFELKDTLGGTWLRVNKVVPFDVALKVAQLVGGAEKAGE